MSVLAIDIDLGRITAVDSHRGVLCHGVDPFSAEGRFSAVDVETVLIEIAGPVMHHEESHSHRRWMLYNAAVASILVSSFVEDIDNVLVATSTDWTKGYSEIERDAVAGIRPLKYKTVTRKKGGKSVITREPIWAENHDTRECRAMLYFHARDPKPWKPLDQYLKDLVRK